MLNETLRIVFTGDIAFSQVFKDGWKGAGCLSDDVAAYLRGADRVVANVECPLTSSEIQSDRPLNHAGDPQAGEYLARMNIKTWSLANNHMMDCGVSGLRDTLRCARDNGCDAIGAGENEQEALRAAIYGDTVKVGVLSTAGGWEHIKAGPDKPGTMTLKKQKLIARAIQELKKKVRWVVVVSHAGDEYCNIPLSSRRSMYLKLLDMGADVIVGHHPHVVQQYEYVGEKLIVYSLGNFIFDTENQRKYQHTDTGMLLGINFGADGFVMDSLPVHIDRTEHKVEKGTVPAIFQNITAEEYKKLWPLSARVFYPTDLRNHKTLSKRKLYKYKFLVFLLEVYKCRHSNYRSLHFGRFLSLWSPWKESTLQDVVEYIKQ